MSIHCCTPETPTGSADPRYRRVLWIALLLNAAMFVVELAAGVQAGSVSLLADAIDFLAMRPTTGSRSGCWPCRWSGAPARRS